MVSYTNNKMETITSLQNPKIKNLVALQEKSKERRKQQLFVVEGQREIRMALSGDYKLHTLFVCDDLLTDAAVLKIVPQAETINVSKSVFEKIAYRGGSDGLLALFKERETSLSSIRLSKHPFIIILEAVEKPGNLGAILRTADAAQVDAVLICDARCDVFNPNVIRSSLGCVFSRQTAVCSSMQAVAWLREHHIQSYAAELTASQWYHQTDFTKGSAIVMGTEAVGLSDFWLAQAEARIKIPMLGKVDSLNVSVSTAVLTFEAMRQRGFGME